MDLNFSLPPNLTKIVAQQLEFKVASNDSGYELVALAGKTLYVRTITQSKRIKIAVSRNEQNR